MFGMEALEIVIGLVFIYLLLSLLATTINEMIANLFSLRGKNLFNAISWMLNETGNDGLLVEKFNSHSLIKTMNRRPWLDKIPRLDQIPTLNRIPFVVKNRPVKLRASYMPNKTFSRVLLESLLGEDEKLTIQAVKDRLRDLRIKEDSQVYKTLDRMVQEVGDDMDALRLKIENWFDHTMDQATQWYKNKMSIFLLVIGFVISFSLNADTFQITKALAANPEATTALVAAAEKFRADSTFKADFPIARKKDSSNAAADLDTVADKLTTVAAESMSAATDSTSTISVMATATSPALPVADISSNSTISHPDTLYLDAYKLLLKEIANTNSILGMGWSESPGLIKWFYDEDRPWKKLLGWLITTLAISLGSQFWFDTLHNVMRLRTAVKRKEPAGEPPVG